jgi:hypothetical protein
VPSVHELELLLVRTSPHEEYSELNGILRLAQLHRPNSGMSDDVAGQTARIDSANVAVNLSWGLLQ